VDFDIAKIPAIDFQSVRSLCRGGGVGYSWSRNLTAHNISSSPVNVSPMQARIGSGDLSCLSRFLVLSGSVSSSLAPTLDVLASIRGLVAPALHRPGIE
jgi:hypothetical protein